MSPFPFSVFGGIMEFINRITKNKIMRVLLIVLLCFCMIFCAFVYQVETAHALVAEAAIVGVVSSLLISVGFAYSSPAQWDALVDSFTNFINGSDSAKEIITIAGNLSALVNPVDFVFNATPSIISSLASWINKYWNSDSGSVVIPGSGLTIDGISMSKVPIFSKDLVSSSQSDYDLFNSMAYPLYDLNNLPADGEKVLRVPLSKSAITKYPAGTSAWLIYRPGPPHGCFLHYTDSSGSIIGSESILGGTSGYNIARTVAIYKAESGNYYLTLGKYIFSSNDYNLHNYGPLTGAVATGSVESKPNSTYFPKEVVGSSSGSTIFPNNTASKPLTSDTPLTIPEAGVNSDTTIGDVRPDVGTGEGSLTITGLLTNIWEFIKSIPASIASFFDPSGFELDFSKLKVGLTSVFPFCIPFDLARGVKTLVTDSSGFNFNIKLDTSYFDINHTVNLTPFKIPILFFRFICDFWFCYILISRTRDWIKW